MIFLLYLNTGSALNATSVFKGGFRFSTPQLTENTYRFSTWWSIKPFQQIKRVAVFYYNNSCRNVCTNQILTKWTWTRVFEVLLALLQRVDLFCFSAWLRREQHCCQLRLAGLGLLYTDYQVTSEVQEGKKVLC